MSALDDVIRLIRTADRLSLGVSTIWSNRWSEPIRAAVAHIDQAANSLDYEKTIPITGLGTLTIGGVVVHQLWLPSLAIGVVVLGAVAIRLLFRRSRGASDG